MIYIKAIIEFHHLKGGNLVGEVIKVRNFLVRKSEPLRSKFMTLLYNWFIEKQLLLFLIGLLLGRAVILFNISPFAIAFIATTLLIKLKRSFTIAMFILIGAWSHSASHGVFMTISLMVLYLMYYFIRNNPQLKWFILAAFLAPMISRLFLYSFSGQMTIYEWLHLFVESVLAVILLLIFMQSIPLLSLKNYRIKLKNEELICLIILFSSILTGFIGWELYDVSFELIFSRYIVLTLAYVGGAAVGTTVGVVAGLILSLANVANLYQMSLLAFSGLLGGLLKEGSKIGVAFGLFVGTFLVSLYGDLGSIYVTMTESTIAIALFFLTPKKYLKKMAALVPGTNEYTEEERKYLQRMRNVTAERVEQFSEVFAALSKSFMTDDHKKRMDHSVETDYLLSNVTEKVCENCFMKKRCWQKQFDETYSLLENIKTELIETEGIANQTMHQLKQHCVKNDAIIHTISDEVMILKMNQQLKEQMVESKKIVAEQLQGVSEVMDHFAKEIMKERKRHEKQEIQIIRALKQLYIQIEKIDIFNLERGNIDIEIHAIFSTYRDEGEKLIAPLLSDILDETIVVKRVEVGEVPHSTTVMVFQSAKLFEIQTGVAIAAKGGGLISGDSYSVTEISSGKYALAISDGMGNGARAREESMETLRLLRKMLQTGISEQVAIRSINSILSLRTTDEMFATLDLAVINLHNAHLRFLKIGSAPSFIKRGNDIIQLEANNVPIGIIDFVTLDIVQETLQHGDILIMMSDGVYDAPNFIKNHDVYLRRKIRQLETDHPQEIADLLLEEVIRNNDGVIRDDMTIIAAKITKMKPKWSTIPANLSYV